MEKKEKIVLNDGTVFNIENGAIENSVQVVIPSISLFEDTFNKFTDENLESYQIQNALGLTCATLENKHMDNAVVRKRDDDVVVTFNLSDVNMLEKRVDVLENGQMNLKESQDVQDGAISELGDVVSEMLSVNTGE